MMLSISRCSLNPNHHPQPNTSSTSKSSHAKSSHLPWLESQQRQRSWRSGCLALGAATLMMISTFDERINITVEEQPTASASATAAHPWRLQDDLTTVASKLQPVNEVQKWSDRRMCPPWHLNSLETIVPENLPRPFTYRRWQPVESIPDHPPSSSHHQLFSSQKKISHGKDVTSPNSCFLL